MVLKIVSYSCMQGGRTEKMRFMCQCEDLNVKLIESKVNAISVEAMFITSLYESMGLFTV